MRKQVFRKRNSKGILTNGKENLSFAISYSSDRWEKRLVFLKEEAKKAGLELNLRKFDWPALVKFTGEKKHDLVFMSFQNSIFPSYRQVWYTDASDNLGSFSDPALDRLIDRYDKAKTKSEKARLSREIQMKIHDSGVFVPCIHDLLREAWGLLPVAFTRCVGNKSFKEFIFGI